MQYFNMFWQGVKKFFVIIWNLLSLFFGFPYEKQAKKLGDYDARGEDNPKIDRVAYRANKVSKQ